MNPNGIRKRRLALIAPIEHEARALGKRVYRQHPVVTPRLEGSVDLLVADDSHQTVYGALNSLDLVHWNLMKAREKKAHELRLIFPNGRMAHAAEKLVEQLRASGKAGSLSVLCLTAQAAVELLKNSNGTNGSSTSIGDSDSQAKEPSHRLGTGETPTARNLDKHR